MNDKDNRSDDLLKAPADPDAERVLWAKLRNALEQERGYRMTLERIGRMIGKPTSTTDHWLTLSEQPHVRAYICLLERLSDEERVRVLGDVCRTFPSVMHPRLAHKPEAVEAMLRILRQPWGLTIIRGGTTVSRTFVLTALGHTFPQLDRRHRMPGGLDVHQPDKIVPVEGVMYLRNPLTRERLTRAIGEAWPQIQASASPLLLFNELWSLFPGHREEILGWARQRHVVLADSAPPVSGMLVGRGLSRIRVINISQDREPSGRIDVSCQVN